MSEPINTLIFSEEAFYICEYHHQIPVPTIWGQLHEFCFAIRVYPEPIPTVLLPVLSPDKGGLHQVDSWCKTFVTSKT